MSAKRVRVHAMTIGLPRDQEPTEWYACCTDADWSQPGGVGCNWYGQTRDSRQDAEADAARHRRLHREPAELSRLDRIGGTR